MHGRFRHPFGGPPPMNFMNRGPGPGNFERPPWIQQPPMPPPCRFGPPQSRWNECPPNFNPYSIPRPPFPPPRGSHSFEGRGSFNERGFDGRRRGFDGRGRGFDGRGRGFDGRGRGFFDDRGRDFDCRGRGGDHFRGRGGIDHGRGRGGIGGRGGYDGGGRGGFPIRGRGGPPQMSQCDYREQGLHMQRKKVKKEKVDKRDLAENNVFRCDSCDRGFKTKEIFEKHVSEHEQCPYEGCAFIAAPKLVRIHVQCQHVETNIAPLVWKSMSPEELEQWKAERRRHYPTKENIARKKAEAEARAARGELLENKYFGKMRGRGGMRGQGGGREGRGRGVQGKDRRKRAAEEDGDTPPAKWFTPSPPQDGHESRLEDRTRSLMANDAVSNGSVKTPLDEKASKALASIASAYDGDSNNGDGGDSDDEAPEELDIGRVPLGAPNRQKAEQQQQEGKGTKRNGLGAAQKYNNPSLLQRLLANDIRHERNLILQCIYYIVEKNFFREEQRSTKAEEQEHVDEPEEATTSQASNPQVPVSNGKAESS